MAWPEGLTDDMNMKMFKPERLKFSKLKNQGQFIFLMLNEAVPDLMVAFLGPNSNFEKKVRGA